MSHEENRYIRGTAWHATSVGARTLLSHMSWGAGDSQSAGLRLVEEPPVVAERLKRVRRGGSWNYVPLFARVALRHYDDPGYRNNLLGVRLVEETGLEEPEKEPALESRRVLRGSSWFYAPLNARDAYATNFTPDYCDYNLGFRLVEEINE